MNKELEFEVQYNEEDILFCFFCGEKGLLIRSRQLSSGLTWIDCSNCKTSFKYKSVSCQETYQLENITHKTSFSILKFWKDKTIVYPSSDSNEKEAWSILPKQTVQEFFQYISKLRILI